MAVYSNPVEITVVAAPTVAKITLSISPTSGPEGTTFVATGQVTDQYGHPMSGVEVHLFLLPYEPRGEVNWRLGPSGTTDSNGNFSISIPSEQYLTNPSPGGANVNWYVVASDQNSVAPSFVPQGM